MAIGQLERLFSYFPDAEKYFIDLSGKGEPLLNIKTILAVAEYCKRKSDELRREVLPMLVCNGTLLSRQMVDVLQKHGILFGVSLDGIKEIHDRHRKSRDGNPTFDLIMENVKSIPNRDYVGCAATITNDVFDLTAAVFNLSYVFKTLSFRFARGADFGLSGPAAELWAVQYEKLANALLGEIKAGNLKQCLCLMNGDDYFGRFICRAVLNQRTINRCDGGISRFACDSDGKIYPCSASVCQPNLAINEELPACSSREFLRQAHACEICAFKRHCGGECRIEKERLGHPNPATCKLTIRIIQLAFALSLVIAEEAPDEHKKLVDFAKEKQMRYRADQELNRYLHANPSLSFSEAKIQFDRINKRY